MASKFKILFGEIKMYNLFYWMMMFGYGGLTLFASDLKSKIIGILLLIVNGILFWRN